MKNIRKGFLLNFAYEGSHIIFKLFLFCIVFYITQVCIGYSLVKSNAELITVAYGYNATGFLWYNDLFNGSIMPYILTAFMVASFFGIYYIFKKDKMGTNKLNAIYTLPFPRYCNFYAKLFYCLLCPISVFAMQILANLTIIQFKIENVSFRENELFLSSQFDGVYQTLFTPSPAMAFVILVVLTFAVQFFSDYIFRSVASDYKGPSIKSFIQTVALVTAVYLMFRSSYIQNFWIYFYAIAVCILSIIIDIFIAYRKVRI